MINISHLPTERQQYLREERTQARAVAKDFVAACRDGDAYGLRAAASVLLNNIQTNWTAVFQQVARLGHVGESIQQEFQLLWIETRLSTHCACNAAVLDALHILFGPYHGPSVRLYRGANAHEARARKFYGISWSSDIEKADWFARHYQTTPGGTVVLETLAPPAAIIAAPGISGPYFESADGERLYDEREYLVDGRRLHRVTVARRYSEASIEQQLAAERAEKKGGMMP